MLSATGTAILILLCRTTLAMPRVETSSSTTIITSLLSSIGTLSVTSQQNISTASTQELSTYVSTAVGISTVTSEESTGLSASDAVASDVSVDLLITSEEPTTSTSRTEGPNFIEASSTASTTQTLTSKESTTTGTQSPSGIEPSSTPSTVNTSAGQSPISGFSKGGIIGTSVASALVVSLLIFWLRPRKGKKNWFKKHSPDMKTSEFEEKKLVAESNTTLTTDATE